MADKIKPLKIENPSSGGTDTDFLPTESNPTQDYVAAKGIAFENNDNRLFDLSASGEIQYKDAIQGTYKTLNSITAGSADFNLILTDNFFDVLVDLDGNVLIGV
jgi:hypothetical protein